jgi:glutaminyl-peptide cyclotransferase
MKLKLTALAMMLVLFSCTEDKPSSQTTQQKPVVVTPSFSGDSAYKFVADQVAFGPRVPNTTAHANCAVYLKEKLEGYGADVIVQEAVVTAFDGKALNMKNIIGQFSPEKKNRVMLYAHWDTRPFADKDSTRQNEPIDGANDGGSGVGVLLEIARLLHSQPTNVGVDIVFFDTEDYGAPEGVETGDYTDWCLGSQYWAKNKHVANYRAKYGILLDMVGSSDAVFNREGTSMATSPMVVDKVWRTAQKLGYGGYFKDTVTPQTVDDNYFVTVMGGIPSANIVQYHVDVLTMGYGFFHHTHKDNMDIIDPNTLKAVGQTVADCIYQD